MNDLAKGTEHALKRLSFYKSSTVYDYDIEILFGKVPEESLKLLPVSGMYWNSITPLVDWILNNTEYKIVGVTENTYCLTNIHD